MITDFHGWQIQTAGEDAKVLDSGNVELGESLSLIHRYDSILITRQTQFSVPIVSKLRNLKSVDEKNKNPHT